MVTDAVEETIAVAGLGDDVPRSLVDLCKRASCLDHLERRHECLQDQFIDFFLAFGESTVGGDGSCHVRGVTLVAGTGVDHDEIAVGDGSVVGCVMQHGAVQPGSDDRVIARTARAVGSISMFKRLHDVPLRHARFNTAKHAVVRGSRNFAGLLNHRLFGLALDGSHHGQHRGAIFDLDV